ETVELVERARLDRLIVRDLRRGAREVGVEGDLSADPHRLVRIDVEGAIIVDDRMRRRQLRLQVVRREALEIIAPHVEVATVALAREIDGRRALPKEQVPVERVLLPVVLQEVAIRERRHVPSELPIVVGIKLAPALHGAAVFEIRGTIGRRREAPAIVRPRPLRQDDEGARLETLSVLALAE